MKDAVVVGGGIAGLTAAWRLRDLDTILLESEPCVGGRIRSFERDGHWVSVGAHMFPGRGSFLWELLDELRLERARIHGSLLGIAYRRKIVTGGHAETFPFRLPLSPAARISFVRAGLRIRRDAARYTELARRAEGETESDVRRRLLGFLDDRTWAEYVGPVHPQVEAIFRATANRLTAEPDEVAAGCMVALFAHVWSTGGVELGFNLRNGPSSLPSELARRLGEQVVTGAQVVEVAREAGSVRVRYLRRGREEEVSARCAIVATPAPVARRIVLDLPAETAAALDAIVYGPFVVAGILTDATTAWDDVYSVLTVDSSFNMLFNHSDAGGALMVYGGAGRARRLLAMSDDEIASTVTADLHELYPEAHVREVIVQRWENAIPFAAPGRARVQAALERGVDDTVFFAGDYVGEWTHMESAALTAAEAAAAVRARVDAPLAVS
ncbi:MAG: FAD-dependent oxidoreductase [Actinobacteria bacterium]|nr:MAG: FAD-dependent oxidoreductase [Actinomycetota bacterium]